MQEKMKKIITILTFYIPIILIGQETKEIVVKFPNSKQIRERYTVLKSDKNIKSGEYIRYYKSSKKDSEKEFIHSKGNFTNGNKNGEWIFFQNPDQGHQGKVIKREFYKNGIKTGVWETYHYEKEGKVIEKFDFDNNTPLEPIISVPVHYPNSAKKKGIQGIVEIEFKQLDDCSIEDIIVIKSIDPECDKEAIKSIRNLGILQKKYSVEKCQEQVLKKPYNFKMN